MIPGPINENSVNDLKIWFNKYVDSFRDDDPEIQQNLNLKIAHTERVCREIKHLGKELELEANALHLAEIIALLHDIGRFEQYAVYKTFKDSKSENHALLGLRIIKKNKLLNIFDPNTRKIIVHAIKYHNRATLPSDGKDPFLFYDKLIRDADKLDIWHVVLNYYYRTDSQRNSAIELDLPDTPSVSKHILDDLHHGRIIHFEHVNNLNDFKLLQMGWIFDINFEPTRKVISERDYLKKLRRVLPASSEIDIIYENIIYKLRQVGGLKQK